MASGDGSEELHPLEERALRAKHRPIGEEIDPMTDNLTSEEQDRIADGEPYCFRCGKPASSFAEYCHDNGECGGPPYPDAVAYVREEEGTYNPATNRFACDECYIAIGQPVSRIPFGPPWQAP